MILRPLAEEPWIRWDWVERHLADIGQALAEHVLLTVVAVAGGLVIAWPLALAARRWARVRGPVLVGSGALYTIPSLALFALLLPFTGLTPVTAEIGLIVYTLAILVRNIVVGLDGVPADVREAAAGMGYGPVRRLVVLDVPLALPAILAGVRLATVTTVALVTITALIGEGGLGRLILDGLIRDFRTPLVVGGALSIALAVSADVGIARAQRALMPWVRAHEAPK